MSRSGEAFGIHVADQLEAATRDARAVFEVIASAPGRIAETRAALPGWVEAWITAHNPEVWPACTHVGSPRVVHIALWRPGLVLCTDCLIREEFRIEGTIEDRRCDRCGHVGAQIHPIVTGFGPLLIHGGLCCQCSALEEGRPCDCPRGAR